MLRLAISRCLPALLLALLVGGAAACGDGKSLLDAFATDTPTPSTTTTADRGAETAAASTTPTPAPVAGTQYTVESGDTLGAIAVQFGVTVDAIVQANDLTDANQIAIGQTLEIPSPTN